MFKQTVIAVSLGLALSSAAQAEYQFELATSAGTGDIEINNVKTDQEYFGLTGTYYLDRVDTSKGPLSEAAFLDRASSVEIDVSTGEIDGDNGNIDVDSYAADSRFVSKDSGWLVDLGYSLDEIDNEQTDTFSIGAGKYVLENTAVVVSYTYADTDEADNTDAYELGLEHLWMFEQGAVKLDTSVAVVDPQVGDDINVWGLGGTYYVNPKLGFGAAYELLDSNETDQENASLFAKWFVTEKVELALAYSEQKDNDIDFNTDAIEFTADVRF